MNDISQSTIQAQRVPHHYGIDAMRIFAMFMIVYHHVIDHGGTLAAVQYGSPQYYSVTLINVLAYCGVDCFAIISGYVGVNAPYGYKRLFKIWLQVVFFNLVLSFTYQIATVGFSFKDFIWYFFPITQGYYWYVTAYAIMFFSIPILNAAVKSMTVKDCRHVVWSSFIILSIFNLFPILVNLSDRLVNKGYTALWLAFMYLLGAFIRQHGLAGLLPELEKLPKLGKSCQRFITKIEEGGWFNVGLFLFLGVMAWIPRYMIPPLSETYLGHHVLYGRFCVYNSPTMVLTAIAVLFFFLRINPQRGREVLRTFGALTLGIYIVHFNPVVKSHVLDRMEEWFQVSKMNFLVAPIFLVFYAFILYFACMAVEYIRYVLFKKIGKIN